MFIIHCFCSSAWCPILVFTSSLQLYHYFLLILFMGELQPVKSVKNLLKSILYIYITIPYYLFKSYIIIISNSVWTTPIYYFACYPFLFWISSKTLQESIYAVFVIFKTDQYNTLFRIMFIYTVICFFRHCLMCWILTIL